MTPRKQEQPGPAPAFTPAKVPADGDLSALQTPPAESTPAGRPPQGKPSLAEVLKDFLQGASKHLLEG
jgi:hypothetical protein